MRLALPTLAAVAMSALALGACSRDSVYEYPSGSISGAPGAGVDAQTPNFAAAWVYNYSNGTGTLPHGDVHRLSDGSYSVLRMPGGTNMELIRFSPDGIPLGTKAFKVPQTYAGCPFMPSEETFIDDSSILSYGSSVFRVDLMKGEVMWTADFSGRLEHSSRGFWVMEYQSNGAARIRPLDIVNGALEPGLTMPASVGGGASREYIGVRVIYDRNEGTDRAFRGDEATPATRRYVVAHLEARGAASGASSASRLVLEAFRDGDVTPRWTFNHDFVRANYGRPNYAVVDGQLLAAAGNDLLSVDLSTGDLSWTYGLKRAGGTAQTPYGFSDVPMHVSADGAEVRFWDLDGVYHRLGTAAGKELGRVSGTIAERLVTVEPIGEDYLLTAAQDDEVALYDARDGSKVRVFRGITSEYHAPVGTFYDVAKDRLVLAGGRGIYALDEPATNVID